MDNFGENMSSRPEKPSEDAITQLLKRLGEGESGVRGELWQLVYDRLHALAEAHMKEEREEPILQTSALINEAYMRIAHLQRLEWRDRNHFFGVAAGVMRRILVDEARKRNAVKRGEGDQPVRLDTSQILPEMRDSQLIVLDDALQELAKLDERQAKIVELRFFAGFNIKEVAEILGVSERTVDGDWAMARAWLRQQLDAEK